MTFTLDQNKSSQYFSYSKIIYRDVALDSSLILAGLTPFFFLTDPDDINRFSPNILFGICIFALYRLSRLDLSALVFCPISWFLLVCSIYYGIGPLLYIYGNEFSVSIAHSLYFVNEYKLYRTNLLNFVSISLVLFSFSMGMRLFSFRPFKHGGNDAVLAKTALYFSAIGILFTLLTYVLRLAMGESFLMPGVFYTLAKCSHGGLFIYSFLYFRGFRRFQTHFWLMTCFVGYFAVTSLMKQNMLEFVLMVFLGYFLAHPSVRKLVIAAAVVLILFPVLALVTDNFRYLLWMEHSSQVSGLDLVRSAQDVDKIESFIAVNQEDQGSWRRISYAGTQAFSMDEYDLGRPGSTFAPSFWALVPRLLYPDKPVITLGDTFALAIKGEIIGGGVSAGYFGEAYWNYGWPGVFFVCLFVGLLFAAYTQFNHNLISTKNYHFCPVAFMMLAAGYRVDDWLSASTINSIPLMVFLYIMIQLIVGSRRQRVFVNERV